MIERLDELVLEFKDLVPKEWCDLMIEWFNTNSDLQKNGRVANSSDEQSVILDFKVAIQSIVPFDSPMFSLITKVCHMAYDELIKKVPTAPIEDIYFRDYTIRIYEKNEGIFKQHVDQVAGGTSSRVFTIILYLNDVEIGGETEFPTLNKKIRPERGKVLMFPSNFLFPHQGNIPISDPKYILTAFVNFKSSDNLQ